MTSSKVCEGQDPMPEWVRWISEEEVQSVLTWDQLLPAVRRALVAYTLGAHHPQGAIQPLRTRLSFPEPQGAMLVMPGLLKEDSLVVKVIARFPTNAARGLNLSSCLVMLMQSDTGLPTAILEGKTITEFRTAAASAVATLEILQGRKELEDGSMIIAVLGAGAQGRAHARVMAHILKPKKILLWARRLEAAQELCAILCSEGIPAEAVSSVQEAVEDADVINSCTFASTPILKAEWVKPRAHINSVGATTPNHQEMEEDLVRAANIYTDSFESARTELGDIIKAGAEVLGEIGELILHTKPVLNDKITIFKSLGLAVQDAVSAKLVYDLLKEKTTQ
nr:ketimine reductase mu-crystallin-like [Cherax quadricarinatus]XP_053653897.1 ketimine reductase mu-crystallin-like [Cherax quadricarinatus]